MQLEAKAFMTGNPISIEPDSSAIAALDLMINSAIRHLPVLDKTGRIRGVLSIDDLRAALPIPVNLKIPPSVEERLRVPDMLVGEVMTYAPMTLRFDAPLGDAVSRMLEGRIGCLLIVDEGGHLDGILTETDLLHALATTLRSASANELPPASADLLLSLERERTHLAEQLEAYEQRVQACNRRQGETPMDTAELGKNVEEGFITEELAEIASRRLYAIENALERAERGDLEICERCGGRIPEPRLRALPSTTLCIRCAREGEEEGEQPQ